MVKPTLTLITNCTSFHLHSVFPFVCYQSQTLGSLSHSIETAMIHRTYILHKQFFFSALHALSHQLLHDQQHTS